MYRKTKYFTLFQKTLSKLNFIWNVQTGKLFSQLNIGESNSFKGILGSRIFSSETLLKRRCLISSHLLSADQLEMGLLQTGHHRKIHTHQKLNSPHLHCSNNFLEISLDSTVLQIPYVWLRDHCSSDTFYNHSTEQKKPQKGLLTMDLNPEKVSFTDDNSTLSVTWKDGHISTFGLDWLTKIFYPGSHTNISKKIYWNNKIINAQELPAVPFQDHMKTEIGLRKTLDNLVTYGFSLVEDTPVSEEATKAVAERITFILETVFGKMWTFTSNAARSDTAYTTQSLGAHTDTTYFSTPAGIQVFHCLHHNGAGGETLLVDGFKALELLKEMDIRALSLLTCLVIPHQYKEAASFKSPGYHLYSLGSVVTLHPSTGDFYNLRFNPYDMAPLSTVLPDKMVEFYAAYDKLWDIISSRENELWVKLKGGSVLLVDNWRVLHGRAGFDGTRVVCGCYLPRDDWISKARLMRLIN